MAVTIDEIKRIAVLANLKFEDAELEDFTSEMNKILDYMEKLNELDTENVAPLSHPVELVNVFREDELKPSISKEEALKNAPSDNGSLFKVPKAFGDK